MNYSKKHYELRTQFGGWTRIDMLLAIYDKAIVAIQSLEEAHRDSDPQAVARNLTETHKCVLAIHSGLKPDEHEIAYNIARLLHFVLLKLEEQEFGDAVRILSNLREGFSKIYDEATRLEAAGEIPSLEINDSVSSLA